MKSDSRRLFVKSSSFGILSLSIPNLVFADNIRMDQGAVSNLFHRYPSIDDAIVQDVVGKSHFDLDTVKRYVDKRPELARATWDWGFGDWESAIGAASHVGRRDIIEYLLSKGARPNLFTLTSMGSYTPVRSMIENHPGIQEIEGPHGISLLNHAESGLRMKDTMSTDQIEDAERLVAYLKELGNAGGKTFMEITDDKEKYLGDYRYGEGERDGFTVKLNMRKMISLGKLGQSGGGLLKIDENRYIYNGAPSVEISFQFEGERVVALKVKEPELELVARKVS